jgi:hypothetical protein
MITKPDDLAADNTFPSSSITNALKRREAVVYRYAHQWSPGAAAVADAIATAFRRRSNLNLYVPSLLPFVCVAAHVSGGAM